MDSGKAGVGGVVAKPNLWWRLTVYLLLSLRNLRLAPTTPIPALSERVDCSFFFFFKFHRHLLQAAMGVVFPVRWDSLTHSSPFL